MEEEYYIIDRVGKRVKGPFKDKRFAQDEAHLLRRQNRNNTRDFEVETVEQDDEPTDDEDTTMNYDFISNDDEAQDETNQRNEIGNRWTLGDHSTANDDVKNELHEVIEETIDDLDSEVDQEMVEVLSDASSLLQDSSVTNFQCPECGLIHGHADHKHDIRAAFNVEDDFASQMDFVPYCHCGVNELAMLMRFFSYISEPVFKDQHKFESVLDVKPEVLEASYRVFDSDDVNYNINNAVRKACNQRGLDPSKEVPADIREEVRMFFYRRQEVERAANGAPVSQQTVDEIALNKSELEDAVLN